MGEFRLGPWIELVLGFCLRFLLKAGFPVDPHPTNSRLAWELNLGLDLIREGARHSGEEVRRGRGHPVEILED